MKKVFVMIALVIGMIGFAQPGEGKRAKGNPEENVETMVKKMTETLGLNEKQQVEVKNLFTEQQKKHEAKRAEMKARKEKGTKPSDEEIAEMKKERIDDQLEVKTKLKTILTEEQYKKWEAVKKEKREGFREKRAGKGRGKE